MRGMEYSYGDRRLNQIALLMTPRAIGERRHAALAVAEPAAYQAGVAKCMMNLRLVDERDQPVGLAGIRSPIGVTISVEVRQGGSLRFTVAWRRRG